jgi:integrase
MRSYATGSVREMRGRWQLVTRYREEGERKWVMITRMTDIPAGPNGEGRNAAQKALVSWRDSLVMKAAAEEVAAQYERRILDQGGRASSSVALNVPLVEYALAYVRNAKLSKVTGQPIEPTSKYVYECIVRNHFARYLPEGVTVAALTPTDVENFVYGLQRHGYAVSTVRKSYTLLKSVMQRAVDRDGLPSNPCAAIRPPKTGKPRLNVLTVEDAEDLARRLAHMRQSRVVVSARMALACGMREGEICALKVADCGLGDGFLKVRGSVAKTDRTTIMGRDGERGSSFVKSPKSDAGVREIPMNGELRQIVTERVKALQRECAESGRAFGPGLYLVGYADGRWFCPGTLSHQWHALSEATGITGMLGKPPTLHDLRHTFATVALAKGVGVKEVQAVLGHSSAAMTLNVYAVSDPSTRVRAMREISRV